MKVFLKEFPFFKGNPESKIALKKNFMIGRSRCLITLLEMMIEPAKPPTDLNSIIEDDEARAFQESFLPREEVLGWRIVSGRGFIVLCMYVNSLGRNI